MYVNGAQGRQLPGLSWGCPGTGRHLPSSEVPGRTSSRPAPSGQAKLRNSRKSRPPILEYGKQFWTTNYDSHEYMTTKAVWWSKYVLRTSNQAARTRSGKREKSRDTSHRWRRKRGRWERGRKSRRRGDYWLSFLSLFFLFHMTTIERRRTGGEEDKT